jgi:hypothetical protein
MIVSAQFVADKSFHNLQSAFKIMIVVDHQIGLLLVR